jgi:hypothetical protein
LDASGADKNSCFRSTLGITIPLVAVNKKVSAYVVLLSLLLSVVNAAGLASLLFSHASKSQEDVCATHGSSCACPKVCAELKKRPANQSCHHSGVPEQKPEPGTSVCLLKAGCGERELLVGSGPLLKDFLPEGPVTGNRTLPVSFLTSSSISTVLTDPFFQFFHPPKIDSLI